MPRKTNIRKINVFGKEIIAKEQYYMGNQGLPTAESEYEWTPEMIEAFKKCTEDIIYFAQNFFTIINRTKREVIKLREYQIRILSSMQKHNRLIANCSRQIGKTTLMTIYALWLAIFHPDQYIVIIANNNNTAKMILQRMRLAYLELPGWIKEPVETSNEMSMKLKNGSTIVTSPTTDAAIRRIFCIVFDS